LTAASRRIPRGRRHVLVPDRGWRTDLRGLRHPGADSEDQCGLVPRGRAAKRRAL